MPWPTGECVPRTLGAVCAAAGIPMLVWTADVLREDRARTLGAGARFLPRPAGLVGVGEAVESLLGERQTALT